MPSTYSTSLRLELMADGEKSGTWGTITNTNLGTLIEQGVAGVASVAHDDSASYTLTTNNGSSDEARNAVVLMTGTLTADREVIVPDVDKVYIFKNGTSGGFALTFKTSGGTGVTIPSGRAAICYVDSGTGTVNAIDDGYFTDSIYIEGSSAGDFITAESTNAGATSGPDIKLYRNSASPADSDVLSKITFTANTDDGAGGVSVEDVEYASINVSAPETNETSGEAGKMVISLKRGGTTQNYIEIQGGTSSDADNDSIVFKTGGSAVLTIDNNQDMLVDTDSKLQFRDSAIYIQSGSDGNLNIEADTAIAFDTDTLYVDSANNEVGIGTTAPNGKLEIAETDSVTYSSSAVQGDLIISRKNTDNTANEVVGLQFSVTGWSGSTTGVAGISAIQTSSASSADLAFQTRNAGTISEAMRITSAQKVIIGDTSTRGTYGLTVAEPADGVRIFGIASGGVDSLHFDQARGSVASPTASNADGDGSFISFSSYDGTNWDDIGSLAVVTDGAQDAGRMIFRTTATGGSQVERLRIDSSGTIILKTLGAALQWNNGYQTITGQSAANDLTYRTYQNHIFKNTTSASSTTDGTEVMRIDSGGRVLIGYTANTPVANFNPALQAVGQGTSDFHGAAIAAIGFSNNSNGAYLNFGSGRSNTAGTFTSVVNDDTLGQINFAAADGTDMNSRAAFIMAQVDGAPGSNDTPGRLQFSTTAVGGDSPVERMRITQDGKVGIGTTDPKTILDLGNSSGQKLMLWSSSNIKYGIAIETSEFQIFAEEQAVITFGGMNRTDGTTFDEHMRIDSSGNVGIGTISPLGPLDVATSFSATLGRIRNQSTGAAALLFQSSDTGTSSGDGLYIGRSAAINYLWTYENEPIVFATNNLERMRLLAGGGLTFNGDTASSNALDDYEEGTWTPTLTFGGASVGMAFTTQSGSYVKIGTVVTAQFRIELSSKGSSTGAALFGGLPFNATSVGTLYPAFYGLHHDVNSGSGGSVADTLPIGQITRGANYWSYYNADSTTTIGDAYFNNNSVINGTVTFRVT